MGIWTVDTQSTPGVLRMTLVGAFSREEMAEMVAAHNAAIDAFRGADYRVWCDIRALTPLAPDAAELMEAAKRHSAQTRGFRGSAVHVTSAMVALQHKRTSVASGVMETELISDDVAALEAHLAALPKSA